MTPLQAEETKNEIMKQFLDTPMEKTIPDQWKHRSCAGSF